MRFISFFVAFFGGLFFAGYGLTQSLEVETEALNLISSFADDICSENVGNTSSAQSVVVEGEVNVELLALLKKLTDIGVEGAGKITAVETESVLQPDLLEAITIQSNCKRDVFYKLIDRFLPTAGDVNPFAVDIENLSVPVPLNLVVDGQRFSMQVGESVTVGTSSRILSISKTEHYAPYSRNLVYFNWVNIDTGEKSNTAYVYQPDPIEMGGECRVVPYDIDVENSSVSFITKC